MTGQMLAQDDVYRRVREQFLSQPPLGKRGLSYRKLADQLGVGVAGVRAAIQKLSHEGLIESRPQSGTRLRELEPKEYHELYDLRELIEPYAARRAAWWMGSAQLQALDQSCDQFDVLVAKWAKRAQGEDLHAHHAGAIELEQVFHGSIMEAAQNDAAARLVENLRLISYAGYYYAAVPLALQLEGDRRAAREHRVIAAAIRARDGDRAEQLTREHVRVGRNRSKAGLPLAELRELDPSS